MPTWTAPPVGAPPATSDLNRAVELGDDLDADRPGADWLLQDPLVSGESAVAAYLPSKKAAIAIAVTYPSEAFDPASGASPKSADQLWRAVAAKVVPSNPPPTK